ncbi:hypothetical protein OBBRIDRAFT_739850 [Obba rivulosa]|uniref:Transmembrane protein n=1 Tax=Obba rivulosa TaxID=1052685 RepID=A0A8E2AJQ8_9APHY|nr:hypothetical protein OBBRIDRAFT_739850 [Obba rivulosa]
MGISLTEARVLALFFTDIFLGIHLVTLALSLWIQLSKNGLRGIKTKWLLVFVTLIMGFIGVEDAALDAVLNVQVWTSGNLALFTDRASWINIVKIYRCWIVYERRWLAVALPILLWTASAVVSTIFMVLAVVTKSSSGVNAMSLTPWVAASFSITVVLNIITTSLITIRIWNVSKAIRPYIVGQNKVVYVVRIIIESGLLYTLTAIIMLATSVAKTNADYIPGDVLVQMTGIAFNLIIIRFDHNLADRKALQTQVGPRSIPFGSLSTASPNMHIHISHDIEIDKRSSPEIESDHW